jgi:hypothetical protein
MLIQGRYLGWSYGAMLADILGADYEKDFNRLLRLVGALGGPLLMDRYIRGVDYTFGQATLTYLGSTAGMAFAMGLAAIAEVDRFETAEILIIAGGLAGLHLANRILTLTPEKKPDRTAAKSRVSFLPSVQAFQPPVRGKSRLRLIPSLAIEVRF